MEVEKITQKGLESRIDWRKGLEKRVELIKGMNRKECVRIAKKMELINGAEETIRELKGLGFKVGLISGGFEILADLVKEKLDLDFAICNKLLFKNGKLDGAKIIVDQNKDIHFKKKIKELNIDPKNTVALGDGANDIRMLKTAELGIGFNAKIPKNQVDILIETNDLRIIVPYIRLLIIRKNQKKKTLMIPGPTELTDEIRSVLAKPLIGHRTKEFENLYAETVDLIKKIFEIKNDVLILTASNTGGLEAAIANVVEKNDKILTITNGKFGERFVEIIERYGGTPIKLGEWGKTIDFNKIEKILKREKIKAVTLVHNETSTGMINQVKEIGKLANKYNTLFIVDTVSGIGGTNIDFNNWGIDIGIIGTQKALGAPPGLVILTVNQKAWKIIEKKKNRPYYFDLAKHRDYAKENQTPFTPAINLFYGLNEALKTIEREGLDERIKRHELYAKVITEAAEDLGLELYPEKNLSKTVTALKVPEKLDANKIMKNLENFGILIAGGQGKLKGKIIRIGHMGNITKDDILDTIAALEITIGNSKGRVTEKAYKIINNYPKILITFPTPKFILNHLEKNTNVVYKPKIENEELKKEIVDTDILIVGGTKVYKEILNEARKLKTIIRVGHGIDNIDTKTAEKLGIKIYNTQKSTNAVAELTIGLIIGLMRKIVDGNNTIRNQKWEKYNLVGHELVGKTIGIIGLGNIGKRVGKLAKAFDMNVIGYDPYVTQEKVNGIRKVELNVLLENADIVTLHVPLTRETRGMIGEKELILMKKTAILVNTARGNVIDNKVLYKFLKKKQIAGAAFDVYDNEPPINDPLLKLENVITTPHLGAQTYEAKRKNLEIMLNLVENEINNRGEIK